MDQSQVIGHTRRCSVQGHRVRFGGSHRQRRCRRSSGSPTDHLVGKYSGTRYGERVEIKKW